jgi:imidazoleglycerol-phosphate dehydratase
MNREATVRRTTGETDVTVRVDLDTPGSSEISTGVGFLDHMLTLFARHGLLGLTVEASGDLETGSHHTIEDIGITLGQAVDQALGDRAGIERYGSALVPMDEVLVQAAIDISGRPLVVTDVDLPYGTVGDFENECLIEFLRGFANHARLTLHVRVLSGGGVHHIIEGVFKAVARALAAAVAPSPKMIGVPSTKGSL